MQAAVGDRFHVRGNIVGQSDEESARQIRDDRIDILIDLNGHTGLSRLQLCSHKPAPIQATWIGYPNTTGLAAIDYWITDAHLDPPMSDRYIVMGGVRLVDPPTVNTISAAVEQGAAIADSEVDSGADLLITSDLIEPTLATATIAALTGAEPVSVVLNGGLIDDQTCMHTVVTIRDTLRRIRRSSTPALARGRTAYRVSTTTAFTRSRFSSRAVRW